MLERKREMREREVWEKVYERESIGEGKKGMREST